MVYDRCGIRENCTVLYCCIVEGVKCEWSDGVHVNTDMGVRIRLWVLK